MDKQIIEVYNTGKKEVYIPKMQPAYTSIHGHVHVVNHVTPVICCCYNNCAAK